MDETLRDVLEEEVDSSEDEHEASAGAADATPKKSGWLSGIVGAVKTVGSGVKKVGGLGLGLMGKAYNAATGKKSLPAAPEEVKQRLKSTRHKDASDSGGIACKDVATVKDQRSVFSEVIKQIGKNVFAGRDLMYTTFPIRASMGVSILELISRQSSFAPRFLTRAAASDPVERLKLVVTNYIAGLHCTTGFRKPLNPILGETYQAHMDDGTQIFMEQSSHHPPVSSWHVTGADKCYEFFGFVGYVATFRYNKFKVLHSGPRVIRFKDGAEITFDSPVDQYVNLFYGEVRHETLGNMTFKDEKNGLTCHFEFQAFSDAPNDVCAGDIRDAGGNVISRLLGSWLGFVDWDGKCYWDINTHTPDAVHRTPNPLPSDSRYREDAVLLNEGRLQESQDMKTRLEEAQRRDRRLRAAARKEAEAEHDPHGDAL